MKHRWNWRDLYRLPGVLVLLVLVKLNYRKRERGRAPDEWYWADVKLMEWGFWWRA